MRKERIVIVLLPVIVLFMGLATSASQQEAQEMRIEAQAERHLQKLYMDTPVDYKVKVTDLRRNWQLPDYKQW